MVLTAAYRLLAPSGSTVIITFCDRADRTGGRTRREARARVTDEARKELGASLGSEWIVAVVPDEVHGIPPVYGLMQCFVLTAAHHKPCG